ncbi:hypothetical protein FKM82_014519 [Ascaphus truei]
MAARWGAGEDTLTIGGMELFTAGSPLQCRGLDEDETGSGLGDLTLSSMDTGGILGTFQSYIDHSIISIIEDHGSHAANKGHFDEENELSLLTALTEILDNADDENLSPFDTIPDTELLVSPKDRENSSLQKFLSLSRTPPEMDLVSMDEQRAANCCKIDVRSVGQNWDLFPESISSTPKRRNKHRSVRGFLPRRAVKEPTQPRSDGEEEEICSPEKKFEDSNNFVAFEKDLSIDSATKENELEQEEILNCTPCIINTENVTLNDLVKYMHPYCLPSITVCLEPEDYEMDASIQNNAVVLEIVDDEGGCIKLPVLVEQSERFMSELSGENILTLCSLEELVSELKCEPPPLSESSEEPCVPVQEINDDQHFLRATDGGLTSLEKSLEQDNGDELPVPSLVNEDGKPPMETLQQIKLLEIELQDESLENATADGSVNVKLNYENIVEKGDQSIAKAEQVPVKIDVHEPECSTPDTCKNQVGLKVKIKKVQGHKCSRSRVKRKKKTVNEDKPQDVVEKRTVQKVIQHVSMRSSNPSLQESDFLIKRLDQVQRDSQMELRSSKMARAKGRTRGKSENQSSVETKVRTKKGKKAEKQGPVENKLSKPTLENVDVDQHYESSMKVHVCDNKDESSVSEQIQEETAPSDKNTQPENMSTSSSEHPVSTHMELQLKDGPVVEETNLLKGDGEKECASQLKDAKPKPLSLREYRMRVQQRKPNVEERENENLSGSKWPSIPEPPTELAEIPCLMVPGRDAASLKPIKATLPEEKCSPINKIEKPLCSDTLPKIGCVPLSMSLPPVIVQETLKPIQSVDVLCSNVAMGIAPLNMATQQHVPPPFYAPAWPCVPSQPAGYPCLPPLPGVSHLSNGLSHTLHAMPLQPPPVMTWPTPPFPPPPIAMGPVHSFNPAVWCPGFPPPYWPNLPMPHGLHQIGIPPQGSAENMVIGAAPPGPFITTNINVPSGMKMPQHPYVAPLECTSQRNLLHNGQGNRASVQKADHAGSRLKDTNMLESLNLAKEIINQSKTPLKQSVDKMAKHGAQVISATRKYDPPPGKTAAQILTKIPPDPKGTNVHVPDLKSPNQVVFKIMEMLRKQGLQVKPAPTLGSAGSASATSAATQKATPSVTVEPTHCETATATCEVKEQGAALSALVKPPTSPVLEKPQPSAAIPTIKSEVLHQVAVNKPAAVRLPSTVDDKPPHAFVLATPAQEVGTAERSLQVALSAPDLHKGPNESFTGGKGIEASDLTSLLEQFEKSEAKDEQCTPSPGFKLAVGSSGSEKPAEKNTLDRLLAPELVNTAGLTPPATPPHQLWKPITAVSLIGKCKPLHANVQERTYASPVKTTKLIEAKPLPQSKLRSRNFMPASNTGIPPVHVASGDHDYCILSIKRPEQCPVTESKAESSPPAPSSHCEEGSRWNVKHHQNIMIKPIVSLNKRPQDQVCKKLPTSIDALNVTNQSTPCSSVKSKPPCKNIRKDLRDQLDHRTNDITEKNVVERPPNSVLMSPDSSPCRSEVGETRTGVKRENTSVPRRSLRCYRKYKGSPSPQRSSWRGRKSSCSRSCSSGTGSESTSSSPRSRSRSPPSKRRRTYRSRSGHSSRSSSQSSCGSSSMSRSSSCSSRSCSPSSSQSRSRSRSPCHRRYRSRRFESQENDQQQKIYHKERAIEERRVVYIGKINSRMTKSELKRRFSVFGDIEECNIHLREEGDNYGFVTYRYTGEAFSAIENGHKLRLPDELPFDLCFGGRRQFCKSNYADLGKYSLYLLFSLVKAIETFLNYSIEGC